MSFVKEGRTPLAHYQEIKRQRGAVKRASDLRTIIRFGDHPEMQQRNNLEVHAQRVGIMSDAIGIFLIQRGFPVNLDTLTRQAQRHDDPEIITGDISKARKMAMSESDKQRLKRQEDRANIRLTLRYFGLLPSKKRKEYRSDYKELANNQTLESRIIKIADKVEGICETIHDIRCGTNEIDGVLNKYREIFEELHEKEPLMKFLDEAPLDLSMNAIPTRERAHAYSKFEGNSLPQPQRLREEIENNELPDFYRLWLGLSLIHLGKETLFPGWTQAA